MINAKPKHVEVGRLTTRDDQLTEDTKKFTFSIS